MPNAPAQVLSRPSRQRQTGRALWQPAPALRRPPELCRTCWQSTTALWWLHGLQQLWGFIPPECYNLI